MPGFLPSQSVSEYFVAAAQDRLVYPGILQCISITGFSVGGLIGAHVSPGATGEELRKTFEILRSGGGKNFDVWYVVGNFTKHFQYTKVEWWKTSRKIKSALRDNLSKNAKYWAFNTSTIEGSDSGFGINVIAMHTASGVQFSYAKTVGSKKQNQPQPSHSISSLLDLAAI
jgi:hypothetical protein